MRVLVLQSGITIFILFFGISLLEGLQAGNWSRAAFWLAMAITFYVLDRRRESENA